MKKQTSNITPIIATCTQGTGSYSDNFLYNYIIFKARSAMFRARIPDS